MISFIYIYIIIKKKKNSGVAGHPHFGQGGGLASPKAIFGGGRTTPIPADLEVAEPPPTILFFKKKKNL